MDDAEISLGKLGGRVVMRPHDARASGRPRLYLHVGLPKTGTTTLQKRVFPAHPQISYLALEGKGGSVPADSEFGVALAGITWGDRISLDERKLKAIVDRMLEPLLAAGRSVVVSHEGFTGSGGMGIGAKAELLRAVFGEAGILLGIRRPRDMIESSYAQRLKYPVPELRSMPPIDAWVAEALAGRTRFLNPLDRLRYYSIAERYASLFGRQNVLVLPLERMKEDMRGYLEVLCEFIGVESDGLSVSAGAPVMNRRLTPERLTVARIRERMPLFARHGLPSALLWSTVHRLWPIFRRVGDRYRLSEERARQVDEFCRSECRNLMRKWDLPLEKYGYPV